MTVFRHASEPPTGHGTAPLTWLVPLNIHAAARDSFDVCAAPGMTSEQVIQRAFKELPLAKHGWTYGPITKIDARECRHQGTHWRFTKVAP